jgi:hypothetical protein
LAAYRRIPVYPGLQLPATPLREAAIATLRHGLVRIGLDVVGAGGDFG